MARDLREGTRRAPNFEDALAVHRIIAAIERAAETAATTTAGWARLLPDTVA